MLELMSDNMAKMLKDTLNCAQNVPLMRTEHVRSIDKCSIIK